jgi:signal transduction histidine kinase/DNA-binding response OmpR family regulator
VKGAGSLAIAVPAVDPIPLETLAQDPVDPGDAGLPPFRRMPFLTASVAIAYAAAAAWVLVAGWALLVVPGNGPQGVALYATLVVLTALPGGLSLFNSGVLVQEVGRVAHAVTQARRAAHDNMRTKAEFLATMSHEIRTPLNGIVGFAELLDRTRLDARQREFSDAIRESSAHLLSIINDVLDYSKIEAGRVELEEKPVDVAALVESCRKSVSVAAARRGIALHFEPGAGTPAALFGDATRIRQVLLNLLSNAVKFTERGEVRLTTAAEREPDGRYAVSFLVRDTGIGMTEQDQKRLFRAFTQVDPSSTRSHGGTGLGLAISQRLCHLMGGDITVESRPGVGSTFVATIRVPAAPDLLPSVAPKALRGLRIMVVDDDPLARTAVARNAQAWGMLTRSTADAERAMAWVLAGDPFDVAILGHRRGGVNALRLAEALRAAGRSRLPLVLLASPWEPAAAPRLFAARVDRPVRAERLLEALQAAVGRRGPQGEEAPAKAKAAAARSDLRILLVEDNEMNRTLALRVLEGLGYRADVAVNGLDAVRAVGGARRYDVILMDVQMPVMDGLEATRAIYRKVPARERPVIIGLSANALPGDREQCLRAGMDEYAAKPMDRARLGALLGTVARRRTPRQAAASLLAN